MRLLPAVLVSVVLGTPLAARADEPAPVPAAPPGEPAPVRPDLAPPAATDPAELEARFQAALVDFGAGRFDNAAVGFEDVAARSVDPARRTTAAEMAKQARNRIANELPAGGLPSGAPATTSHDGRYVFLIGTSLVGLSLYGPTAVIDADTSSKPSVGLYMITAGASFVIPYLLTRDEPVTWGMTDGWWYGSTRGAVHGGLVLAAAHTSSGQHDQTIASVLTLGSLAEGIGFTAWARATHATAGETNIIGKGSDFGIGLGIGLLGTVAPDTAFTERSVGVFGLGGAVAGYVGGYYYNTRREPTWGDGEVLRATGVVGAYTAVVPLILAGETNRRLVAGGLTIGGVAGLVIGDRLLDGHHFTAGQGVVTELGTLAGAGIGAGLGYLISPDNDSALSGKMIATGAIIGAVGGFTLLYLGLDTTIASPDTKPRITFQIVPTVTPEHKGLLIAGQF